MKSFACIGVNHQQTPVELRERIAFPASQMQDVLHHLQSLSSVSEVVLLSTCNRVEIYCAGDQQHLFEQITDFLHIYHQLEKRILSPYLFYLQGKEALQHLFMVSSSLDAIVVGEPQILGQVKDAFAAAKEFKTAHKIMNQAFQKAFSVAKRVRTETKIAASAVSVSYAGVELARKVFGEIEGKRCLLIGAGEMGELAASHFVDKGAQLWICNRSMDRAIKLAEKYAAVVYPWSALEDILLQVDIVLCSTSAPHFILSHSMMKKVMKQRKYDALFLIDIAVPRDIDPDISKLEGAFCFDVDDLKEVIDENLETRSKEANKAQKMITEELDALLEKDKEQLAVPTIKALRRDFMGIAAAQVQKTLKVFDGDITERQRKSVEAMAKSIVNQILHRPSMELKKCGRHGSSTEGEGGLIKATQELFALDVTEDKKGKK